MTRRNLDTLRSDINNDAAMMDTAPLEALRARLADGRVASAWAASETSTTTRTCPASG